MRKRFGFAIIVAQREKGQREKEEEKEEVLVIADPVGFHIDKRVWICYN